MTHQCVRDVMTNAVLTVKPQTPYKDIVALLDARRIAAVPVVDVQGQVLGVVSETDLLYKQDPNLDNDAAITHRWHGVAAAKAAATVAADVMSAPAVVISAHGTVAEAARTMLVRGIKQLPVVDVTGRLIGLVTTRDLLKIYLRPDAEIRRQILDEVFRRYLRIETALLDIEVRDGIVTLAGEVPVTSQIALAQHMTSTVAGVVAVHSRLTAATDDHNLPRTADMTDY